MFERAGADVLFIEALRSVEDMKKAVAQFGGKLPLLANMVEGGTGVFFFFEKRRHHGFTARPDA